MSDPLLIEVALDRHGCTLRITNVGEATIHLFDSPDLPYVLPDPDPTHAGGLLVLHGFHEPPPEANHYGIEIPPTRPLEPGDALEASAVLDPPLLRSAYESGTPIPGLASPTPVRTAVGWGATPLDDKALLSMSVKQVCREWQTVSFGPSLRL